MLRICRIMNPPELMPDVTTLSESAVGLLLHKNSDRAPHAGRMKWLPNGGCEKSPKAKMSANVLDLRDLVLKAESDHSTGCLDDINDGGWPIPAASVLRSGLPEKVNPLRLLASC